MKSKIFLFSSICMLIFDSCLEDLVNPTDIFEGPSEYNIEFQSGSFTGRTYHLISNAPGYDHEFVIAKTIQKVLSDPIKEKIQNSLTTNSFINWSWQGDTITGQFPAVFATDPKVLIAGNLQLIFDNGDELISSIPKGTLIEVNSFGGPLGAIEGSFSFTSALDYRLNGIIKRETATIFAGFKIKRGPNL